MEATEQLILPHISPAKQDRIRIWRNEVATASLDAENSAGGGGAHDAASSHHGASSSSATSTTTASSSSSRVARGRHVLAKLTRKLLRPSSWRGGGAGPAEDDEDEAVVRTAVYATLAPDYIPDAELSGADGYEDEEPRDAALRDKQERLMRAARLLDKGRAHDIN